MQQNSLKIFKSLGNQSNHPRVSEDLVDRNDSETRLSKSIKIIENRFRISLYLRKKGNSVVMKIAHYY